MPTATRIQTAHTASAILPLVLVFLCGVTVGALAMSLGVHSKLHANQMTAAGRNTITLERWKRELNLTDAQSAQIEQMLDDFSKYYDNVLADGNTRILQILDDKQKLKFQQMVKERR
jgi:uncharacterized membrane-anchored protein YhcB (DUF1043 family)